MVLKRNLICFMSIILLFGFNGIGCSKKGEESVNKDLTNNKQATQEDVLTQTEELAVEPTMEPTVEPSTESNSPWKLISESSVNTSVFYAGFLNDMVGITVGYSGAISYTDDGGKNWSESGNVSACRYGLDFYDESFVVSCGNSGVNLVSGDKGRSWAYLVNFPKDNSTALNKFLSVIDTKNIYVGSKNSLGVSSDGGLTWKGLTVPEECTIIVGMFFLTPEIGYLLSSDGTLYITTNSGEDWTTKTIDLSGERFTNNSIPSVSINFQDEDHGMIVYATKSIKLCCIKTDDGGSTWESVEMPKVSCFTPYISRDGQYLTLSSAVKKICLYKLEDEQ